MLPALNLSKRTVFVSERDPDKGSENETRFHITALPSRVYVQLKDKATSYGADDKNPDGVRADFSPNKIARDMVMFGLKEIDNFQDADGKPIVMKFRKEKVGTQLYDVVVDEILDILDIDTIREVGLAIRKQCEFGDEETKNSEG